MGPMRLRINKGKFVRLLWDRGFKTSVHAARFYTVPADKSASRRLEWFLAWNTPVGNFEARIHTASPLRPMLWVKREGVVIRAESLPEGTLRQYEMIGGNERQDQEAMALANKEKRTATSPADLRNGKEVGSDKTVGVDRTAEQNRRKCEAARLRLWLFLKIFLCALVAVLFVAALLDPNMVPAVANLGVLSCGCVAVVSIDRHFRRR